MPVACTDIERRVGIDFTVEARRSGLNRVFFVRELPADVLEGDVSAIFPAAVQAALGPIYR